MAASGHIFVSYRSIEADFSLRLSADLKNAGVRLWMDRLDGIGGGDDWRRQIEKALTKQSCAAMIAALSPDYCRAEYCLKELSRANRLQIPIFPVLIRPVNKERWPLEIEGVQYIDFCLWRDERKYSMKRDELLALIGQESRNQIADPPDLETQYLTSLIAELDARKGVLEYVELGAQTAEPEPIRPSPHVVEDAWAAGFSMLLDERDGQNKVVPSSFQSKRIHLKSIQDAVERLPQFALIGAPGCGKTTTLRKMAYDAARRRLAEPRTAPLPLFIQLSAWKDGHSVDDMMRAAWPFDSELSGLISRGDVLLYLDGLNEMGSSRSANVKKLRSWLSQNSTSHVVITCRAEDYEEQLKKEQLKVDLPAEAPLTE